jgi:hypothetical protein
MLILTFSAYDIVTKKILDDLLREYKHVVKEEIINYVTDYF